MRVFAAALVWLASMAVDAGALAATPSEQIEAVAFATVHRGDAAGAPFAVVDKRHAQLAVYDGAGRLLGVTPALLGQAAGDWAYPDAARKVATGTLPPHERTTPAGRYESQPGRNLHGERVVWIDYRSALAIHRLRPAPAHERRAERLASATPDDNRITLGCVVVDPAFFDAVVLPVLGRERGVVYVMGETVPEP